MIVMQAADDWIGYHLCKIYVFLLAHKSRKAKIRTLFDHKYRIDIIISSCAADLIHAT